MRKAALGAAISLWGAFQVVAFTAWIPASYGIAAVYPARFDDEERSPGERWKEPETFRR